MSDMSLENRVLEIAKRYIEEDVAPEKIQLETPWDQLGFNSVKFTHLLITIEAEFGFESDDDNLPISSYSNLKDLVDYIKTKI